MAITAININAMPAKDIHIFNNPGVIIFTPCPTIYVFKKEDEKDHDLTYYRTNTSCASNLRKAILNPLKPCR